MFFYLPCCWASRKPITSAKFEFVTRQVEASVVIPAAKLKFVAKSRTRVYFAQHVASNIVFCCGTSWSERGNTRNNVLTCSATMLRGKLKKNVARITGSLFMESKNPSVISNSLQKKKKKIHCMHLRRRKSGNHRMNREH